MAVKGKPGLQPPPEPAKNMGPHPDEHGESEAAGVRHGLPAGEDPGGQLVPLAVMGIRRGLGLPPVPLEKPEPSPRWFATTAT
jgi:hypothetical protein